MEKFLFKVRALRVLFATLQNENVHLLQIERPARCRAKVTELSDEGNVLRTEASSGVEPYLEKKPCSVYGGGMPPVSKV